MLWMRIRGGLPPSSMPLSFRQMTNGMARIPRIGLDPMPRVLTRPMIARAVIGTSRILMVSIRTIGMPGVWVS
jgi:hypothetical protein